MKHQPETPKFESMVRNSFAKQGMMVHLGAEICNVCPGSVEIRLPYRHEALQQHGLFHGGATTAILDTAGGYAAYSLFKPGEEILTVEEALQNRTSITIMQSFPSRFPLEI